ncbi:MAG: hypothetical protein E7015_00415 [Alphaproteobacteria bacterium]|nr:hypothetical protein [Alphaproteobacteria bacterium]
MTSQEVFDFHKVESLNWHDFIESDENYAALSTLMQWPHWNNNGVIITGNKGVGKSHLSSLWAQSAHAVYILKDSINHDPRDLFESDCNFILDGIKNFSDHQDWLFHFYNIAHEKNRSFLIIDRLSPHLWGLSLKDLKSRLLSLSHVEIQDPGDELLFKITKKIAHDYEISISDDVVTYILKTSERNVSTISEILRMLDKLSLQEKRNISLRLVHRYLQKNH